MIIGLPILVVDWFLISSNYGFNLSCSFKGFIHVGVSLIYTPNIVLLNFKMVRLVHLCPLFSRIVRSWLSNSGSLSGRAL